MNLQHFHENVTTCMFFMLFLTAMSQEEGRRCEEHPRQAGCFSSHWDGWAIANSPAQQGEQGEQGSRPDRSRVPTVTFRWTSPTHGCKKSLWGQDISYDMSWQSCLCMEYWHQSLMTQIKIKEIEHEAMAMTGRNLQRVCVTPCSALTSITSSVDCETFHWKHVAWRMLMSNVQQVFSLNVLTVLTSELLVQ